MKKRYGFPENQRLFPIVARTLQKRLKRYEKQSGVKQIRVHDIRHSHVAYLIYQGCGAADYQGKTWSQRYSDDIKYVWSPVSVTAKKVAEMLDNKR